MSESFRLLQDNYHEKRIGGLKHLHLTLWILLFFVVKNFPLSAQSITSSDNYLREIIQKQPLTKSKENIPHFYVLQLASSIRNADIQRHGFRVIKSLGDDLVIVRASPAQVRQIKSMVVAAHPVNSKWKADPALLEMDDHAEGKFILRVASGKDLVKLFRDFEGGQVIQLSTNLIQVSTTADRLINDILELEEVLYAGMESFSPKAESRVLDLYLSPNTINRIHNDYPSLDGAGMTVSIKDQLFDTGDVDLQGRSKSSALSSDVVSNHATDMATIIAGAGNSFINGRGAAPSAFMTSSDFESLLPDDESSFTEFDAWVQNHAYGTIIENFYGATAEAYDALNFNVQEVLHIFSSGNRGMETPGDGPYAGIAGVSNLTGNFKMAKNIITIGSVDTLGNVLSFSSRGPAYDGRVKPELVAYSTQGSSNSAALVSGVSLLLQQAYKETYGEVPSSALLKALLINSARDVGAPGIDYSTGYGSVDAHQSLINLLDGNFFSGEVAHGDVVTFPLSIPSGAKNVKVTLVWNDPPAMPGSAAALINDIDLKVVFGNTWLPWVLDHTADLSKLTLPATRKKDQLNNIEQVTIADVSPGVYNIQVEGYDVPEGIQKFFVAYQWDMDETFTWTFPTASDNFPYDGETGTYFYWRSTLSDVSGKFEYTFDDGLTWKIIDEDIDLTKGQYRWVHLPDVTGIARVRCVTHNGVFETEAFSISHPVSPFVGFNCQDSVMVGWTRMTAAETYQVFQIKGEPFVEAYTVTSDTFMILDKNTAPSRFAIQPVVHGKAMLRSPLFNYNDLGTECYIVSLLSNVDPTQGIFLTLRLGTIYGVEKVDFQRLRDGVFESVGEWIPAANEIQFLDNQPAQGSNQYQVIVHFINGQQSASDIVEEYFLTTLPFIVFPNPVNSGESLTIFSKVFETQNVTFRLYKSDGSLAGIASLLSDREAIPLSNIAPGFYIYTITSPDGVFNGRIVVK